MSPFVDEFFSRKWFSGDAAAAAFAQNSASKGKWAALKLKSVSALLEMISARATITRDYQLSDLTRCRTGKYFASSKSSGKNP